MSDLNMGIWNLTDISSSYHFHIFNLLIELRPSRPSSSCGAENKGLVSLHHETSTKPLSKKSLYPGNFQLCRALVVHSLQDTLWHRDASGTFR